MNKQEIIYHIEEAYDQLSKALKGLEDYGPHVERGNLAHAKDIVGESLGEVKKHLGVLA